MDGSGGEANIPFILDCIKDKINMYRERPNQRISQVPQKQWKNISAVLGQRAVILLTRHGYRARQSIADMAN